MIFETCTELLTLLMTLAQGFYELFFVVPLFNGVTQLPLISDFLNWLSQYLPSFVDFMNNGTLAALLLGLGVPSLVVITLVKWIVGIVK